MWRKHAENVTASRPRGIVVVVGMLKQRSWENDAGEKRYAVEMDIEEIGPGLRYAEAKPVKNPKQGANVGTHPRRVWRKSASDPWGCPPAGAAERRTPVLMTACCKHNPCPGKPNWFLGRFMTRSWRCPQCGQFWVTKARTGMGPPRSSARQ